MRLQSFNITYERAEAGGYYAHVAALGLTTEGQTLGEAKSMARDAIAGYLEAAKLLGKPIQPNEIKRIPKRKPTKDN
jgi:predicted RNase H-like HicB family nuclease